MKTKGKLYLSAAVHSIPAGKPVVFWDTCAIIELLRLSERSINPERDFEQYQFLADKINKGEIISISSELVFQEFNQHYSEELKELQKWEQKLRDSVKKITAIMVPGPKRRRIELGMNEMHTETRVTATISMIWRNTILIREEKKFLHFAYTRVKMKMAPSQNKEQFKDSYIWGTFLNLAHGLNAYSKMYFFSLNKKDYLDQDTKKPCAQILTDLKILPNVEFHYVLGSLYGAVSRWIP